MGHVSFIDRRSVSRGARIAVSERTSEIEQSTDATRMPPLKGNAIGISSTLFYRKKLGFRSGRSQVQSFSSFLFETSNKSSQVFFVVYSRRVRTAFVRKKKQKKESYEKASPRSWRPRVAGCQKKYKKLCRVQKNRKRKRSKRGRPYVEGGKKDDCTTRRW